MCWLLSAFLSAARSPPTSVGIYRVNHFGGFTKAGWLISSLNPAEHPHSRLVSENQDKINGLREWSHSAPLSLSVWGEIVSSGRRPRGHYAPRAPQTSSNVLLSQRKHRVRNDSISSVSTKTKPICSQIIPAVTKLKSSLYIEPMVFI